MIIEPVRDYVVFTFVEDIYGDRFINKTGGPIILTSDDRSQTTYPRWGKAVSVGPEVLDIVPGDFILIEPGKWTSHFYVDGVRHWKTDDKQVMAISDEPGTTY